MRKLNCKRTSQMIALYVAGDLVGVPEREVAAHLGLCEQCRLLAQEFIESSSLIAQACPPPEFSPEFYAGIRNTVLGQISRERRARPWFFGRPWLYATSFAAVVIAFLIVVQYFGGARRQKQNEVASKPRTPITTTDQLSAAASPTPTAKVPSNRSGSGPREQQKKNLAVFRPRQSPGQGEPMRSSVTARAVPVRSTQIAPERESSANSELATTGLATAALPRVSAAAQVSRIEIQTNDPNIRIIWLAPSETGAVEDTNHDQEKQQVNRK